MALGKRRWVRGGARLLMGERPGGWRQMIASTGVDRPDRGNIAGSGRMVKAGDRLAPAHRRGRDEGGTAAVGKVIIGILLGIDVEVAHIHPVDAADVIG